MTGSVTPGERADTALIRADDLNIAPIGDLESTLVRSATPADTDTVLIDARSTAMHAAQSGVPPPPTSTPCSSTAGS
ncbi:hypothetical protein OG271_03435 [Micromonospora rifamycinica]|uniref:hypothetical protein n=1 Tax=Micromonospora rifamycinica TaxID=291594 RepID=UPI002E2CA72E|nr:hypothetical protein [Micromonospora rifamycinica]